MKQNALILVLDDDDQLLRVVQRALSKDNLVVKCTQDPEAFRRDLASLDVDLILLDINLPNGNGLEIAREIRRLSNVPMVFLTGRGNEIDRILGFEVGADDYIVKPFNIRELRGRIRAILRRTIAYRERTQSDEQETTRFQDFEVNLQKRSVTSAEGVEVNLTTTEFDILAVLLGNLDMVVTRNTLSLQTKGYRHEPSDRTIDIAVSKLRRKLLEYGSGGEYIKTIRGRGYMLVS